VLQPVFVATTFPPGEYTVKTGLGRTPVTPKLARVGPTARMSTVLDAPAPMTKPLDKTEFGLVWAKADRLTKLCPSRRKNAKAEKISAEAIRRKEVI
jgi:hypothetical protein